MSVSPHTSMKHLTTILILFCFIQHSTGQTYTIKGSVKDTLNAAPLPLASVVLISGKDSVIESFTRADSAGNFIISTDKQGKYMLRVSFPGFADYVDPMNISKGMTDAGIIAMVSKEHLLKEFVLTKQISAIKIKGDTTEYVADSFKVKENANVEDLLKRLPGIEVDKNGQITAQGETVQKILVDGEEFFSDDPKVVTKGLQANVVDKVQVYDKKSDQAEFTGVDDGQKTKTINLQLKEDKKKGFFGKIDAGGGTDKYYQEQGMLNAFKGKRQVSAFGILSNTDKIGLGWQDNGKFGGGNEVINDEDGGSYFINNNTDDGFSMWDGRYNGQGLPSVATGGIHIADKWNEGKSHITSNYRYSQPQVNIAGSTITQYALAGDSSNVSNLQKTQTSRADRHGFDAMYEGKIDSNNTIKINASAGTKTSRVRSDFHTVTALHTTENDDTLNTNNRTTTNTTTADYINAEVLYKKKFAKKGRTLSVDIKENYNQSVSDGHLSSVIAYHAGNKPDSVVDQKKTSDLNTLSLFGKATYTEPLSKVLNLEVHYSALVNNSTSKNFSFNNFAGAYDLLDRTYSSYYKYNIVTNIGGIFFRWNYKKLKFSAGSNFSATTYTQKDTLHREADTTRSYVNFAPRVTFNYKISNQRSFNFSYNGKTQQPTIAQLQPLRQNADPNNITIGNPGLKQEFIHSMYAYINDYKVLSHRSLYINVNATLTNNAISTSFYNKDGVNTTQYVNVDGNYSISGWMGYNFKLKKPELNLGINFSPGVNHSNNFINGQKNASDNNSFEFGPHASMYKEDKYEFYFSPTITYYDNRATVSAYSTNYWLSNNELSGSVELPKKFEIGTEVNFMFRQQTELFPSNNNVIKWNASVTKKMLKKDQLELKLSVFDILNQNIGYERSAQGSIVTQNNYNTIRRYGMLNVIWNFTYQPGAASAGAGDDKDE